MERIAVYLKMGFYISHGCFHRCWCAQPLLHQIWIPYMFLFPKRECLKIARLISQTYRTLLLLLPDSLFLLYFPVPLSKKKYSQSKLY